MQTALNGFLSLAAALALTYVVLHPRIDEGAWIKVGMVAMIISLLVSMVFSFPTIFGEVAPITAYRAAMILRAGIVVVCIGYFLKARRRRREGLPTDFASLTHGR